MQDTGTPLVGRSPKYCTMPMKSCAFAESQAQRIISRKWGFLLGTDCSNLIIIIAGVPGEKP